MNYHYCGYHNYMIYTETEWYKCLLSDPGRQNPLAPPLVTTGWEAYIFVVPVLSLLGANGPLCILYAVHCWSQSNGTY
jgi:hypothetical protein